MMKSYSEDMKREFYTHPSAWVTDDLVDKQHIAEPLTAEHIAALDGALQSVRKKDIAVEDITREDFTLSQIQPSIDSWIDTVQEGRGLLLLTGFPVERYSKEDCGIIYYGLGTHFGEAQSQSTMGDRLGQVVDIGGKDTRERAYRNSAELSLHTDASDIVAMMCLVKARQGGMSGYCSGPAVYNHFLEHHPGLLDVLFEGFQYHLFGEQASGESPVTEHKVPVFSVTEDYLSVSYLRSYIELAYSELGIEKTPDQARTLDLFDEVAHSQQYRFDLMMEPGDIAVFNNYTVLHTRSEFFDAEEPEQKRHLMRLWLRAWNPRPLAGEMGTYKARKGIEKQVGKGTYYVGQTEYVETLPPLSKR